jgi:hypothetical protein
MDFDFSRTAKEISLNDKYSEFLCQFIDANKDTISFLRNEKDRIQEYLFNDFDKYKLFLKENFNTDLHAPINLYLAVFFSWMCKQNYLSKKINQEIYRDTMGDINIWVSSYYRKSGKIGLQEMGWIRNHLSFRIFRLGRLQFEMAVLDRKVNEYPVNMPCLNIHIPEGEKLDIAKCQKSIEQSKIFFKTNFNTNYKIATCHSWLLHENLKYILDSDSNIIRFGQLFEIIENDSDNSQTLERVFGEGEKISAHLPETTTLQRKLKSYLLQGGEIGSGYGIIKLSS